MHKGTLACSTSPHSDNPLALGRCGEEEDMSSRSRRPLRPRPQSVLDGGLGKKNRSLLRRPF
ncbi:unnamed protein product [Protopolystoma xenopodis]|uniref:Uncharacterized protein n=1 Tax=Protopolystoma xenopodis TaxID=117903 RepID=A0A3S5AFL4_9PLAT|nr:unnamed protein product [Protopolystoma xenopodis]